MCVLHKHFIETLQELHEFEVLERVFELPPTSLWLISSEAKLRDCVITQYEYCISFGMIRQHG